MLLLMNRPSKPREIGRMCLAFVEPLAKVFVDVSVSGHFLQHTKKQITTFTVTVNLQVFIYCQ